MHALPPPNPNHDPTALPALFRAHAAGLAGCVRAILGHDADTQELLQEAFLRAWRALGRGDAPTDPAAWVFVLTMNLARDQRRSRERRGRAHDLSSEDVVLTDERREPASEVAAGEAGAAARAAIARLGDEEKEVFLLRASGEQSFAAVARTLGIPVGTAKTRMRRALCTLRRELASFAPESFTARLDARGELS